MEQAPVVARPGAWLRDPAHPGYLRWWDGQRWTDHYQPLTWTAAAPPVAPADPMLRWLLPVGRSGWAVAAGYAGLFAVLVLPAPVALVLGIVAVRDIDAHPGRLGMGRAIFALVMGTFFSLIFAVTLLGG